MSTQPALFARAPTPPWTEGQPWAEFSADRRYRYALGRPCIAPRPRGARGLVPDTLGTGPRVLVCMLNPSTAGAERDDATVRRLIQFGEDQNWRSLVIVNLFAAVATKPADLLAMDPHERIGPANDGWISTAAVRADLRIVGWGANARKPALKSRVRMVAEMLAETGPLHALRILKDGMPEHPLFLPTDLKPVPWPAPSFFAEWESVIKATGRRSA